MTAKHWEMMPEPPASFSNCSARDCSYEDNSIRVKKHERRCLFKKCELIMDGKRGLRVCLGCSQHGFESDEELNEHEKYCEARLMNLLSELIRGIRDTGRHAVVVDALLHHGASDQSARRGEYEFLIPLIRSPATF